MEVDLSIIIINYRTPALTKQTIQSIAEQTEGISYEVIVVDNLSDDDSEQQIKKSFPGVVWHQMGYNAGFARANNQGIRLSKASVVLLLNPDTIVINEAIKRCYQRFVQTAYVGCSVQLLNPDLTPQISGNYFMKGGLNHLLPLPYWGAFLKMVAVVLKTKKTKCAGSINRRKGRLDKWSLSDG